MNIYTVFVVRNNCRVFFIKQKRGKPEGRIFNESHILQPTPYPYY